MLKRIVALALVILLVLGVVAVGITQIYADTNYEEYAKNLEKTSYDGELGAIYSKEHTTFKVWSPSAESVKLRIYKYGSDNEGSKGYLKETDMTLDEATGVWQLQLDGDYKNKYYTYVVKHNDKTYETSDIYAKACGVNGNRSMIVDLNSTDPEGWDKDTYVTVKNSTDAMIWEIQIADFSHSKSSGVSKENRGKYLAFTEKGTTVDNISGNPATCVDYLKELGVNYVHINPFYDFGSIDETDTSDNDDNYNWGYDPVNYNCPEGSYSSNPYDGNVRIKECKQMIMALHKAGIGVIMDVVYNHTQKDKDSNFNKTVPNYYYRINRDGTWSNGSGCGNDTASERKMYSKYMVDSVVYWAKEYHIDGFRFDLMGLHDVDTMNNIRKALDEIENGENLIMYGEPWNLNTSADSDCVLSNQSNISKLSDRIGAFDDTYRDALKGSTAGTDKGFIQSGERSYELKVGIAGQVNEFTGWAKAATQCVTYGSCHDNLTMWDKLVKSVKGSDADYNVRYNELVAMNKLAGAITYTSQGISFMLAGEEFCRTKNGDENSYSSGFAVNEIDWNWLQTYGDVVEYYKGLIEIRKNIDVFRDPTDKTGNNIKYLENMPKGVIAYTVEDETYGDVCMIFNGSKEKVEISLEGQWVQLANDEVAGMESLGEISKKISVKATSAAILVDKEAYKNSKTEADTGKVIVRYHSGEDDTVFKSYVVSGKIGTSFNISPLQSIRMKYTINEQRGNSGEFSNSVKYCDFYCEEFEGNISVVTMVFLDSKTEKNIAESVVMTNRQGQKYQTASIPAISGYTLNMEKLPNNGCGEFGEENITVKYYYDKKSKDEVTCKVNIIYMADDGKILGTDTKTGEKDSEYSTQRVEFEGYEFVSVTDNGSGTYSSVDQNILYIYHSISLQTIIMYISAGLIALIAIGLFTFFYFRNKKARLMKSLDIS